MKDRIDLGEMAQKKNVSYMESLPLTAGNVTVKKKKEAECLRFLADGGGGAVDSDLTVIQLLLRFLRRGCWQTYISPDDSFVSRPLWLGKKRGQAPSLL